MYSAIEHYVNMALYKCCILLLVEMGLQFLPRDCQGWLPVAWIFFETSWVGGLSKKTGGHNDRKYKIMQSNTS